MSIPETDPQALAEQVVQKMMAHDAFSQWLGIEVVSIAPGASTLRMTVRPEMLNGFRIGHGGIAYALADSAFAFASNSYGRIAVALDNTMTYPAPIHEGEELLAVAAEVSRSHRIAVYDVTVTRADGTKVGLFRGTVYRTEKVHFPGETT